ncbi:hypothetical protein VP01_6864g1, partial [Puccinia sorghi]
KPAMVTLSNVMDKVNPTFLKTSIEGIPLLKNDNYSLWRVCVVSLLDLVGIKEHIVGNSKVKMEGKYIENLPTLEFDTCEFLSHLSSAEFIHESLVTCASYKSEHTAVFKPFEEINLDLIGPIWPCTLYCAAIPIKTKSEVIEKLSFLIDVEAKRFFYHPSTIQSDQGSEFINSALK